MTNATRTWGGTTLADRRADRRRRLVEAGIELLGGGDSTAVTVRAVCRTARLTERYFYESFADRDALMLAVYEHVAESARQAILDAVTRVADTDPEEQARAAVRAFVELLIDDPRKGTVLLLVPITEPALNKRGAELLPTFTAMIRDRLPDGYDDVHRELTATSLIGALTYLFISYLDGSLDVPRERLIEHAVGMLVAAASPPDATS
ncbi:MULTISPECIES: TetR/AcrR family transcriptional regulator [Thermocrispum]|jgi:AcrR family transcriptional regulator|uniref:TetR/AcrR family transcriptional regulator n=2 Tax=Thermocrispum agreste TaxID=37925 RepID=A0ABD6FF90_9PSEU|nr:MULTISPECIES: TetR/AcrR family transcriptional regulator [Thermocrispum]